VVAVAETEVDEDGDTQMGQQLLLFHHAAVVIAGD
jgi:hypothetical protein